MKTADINVNVKATVDSVQLAELNTKLDRIIELLEDADKRTLPAPTWHPQCRCSTITKQDGYSITFHSSGRTVQVVHDGHYSYYPLLVPTTESEVTLLLIRNEMAPFLYSLSEFVVRPGDSIIARFRARHGHAIASTLMMA